MADPFGSTGRPRHPALSEGCKLPPDVFHPLVGDFLQDERYARWAVGYKPWQLHCIGSPGCGKTTFAAIVVNDLKKRYQGTSVRVASIFIREAVSQDHPSFLEDFLACIHSQLGISTDPEEGDFAQVPSEYEDACQNGLAFIERIDLIRTALHELLHANEHNFLVLDGYDQLDAATRLLLHHELKDSHVRNLSLLVTRRSPAYQPEEFEVRCNNCDKGPLKLYWECEMCSEDEAPQFCYECKEQGAQCEQEGHGLTLTEPYRRIDMDISKVYRHVQSYDDKDTTSNFDEFIARELEQEYGVNQSSEEGGLPDASLTLSKTDSNADLVRSIASKSGGNINIAKLRLDEVHSAESLVADVDRVSDRLPRSIIAFFDAEIDRILSLSPANRELGLLSIAAVAECEAGNGMLVQELERRTRAARAKSPHLSSNPVRSVEDILFAANGLLVIQPYDDEQYIACYNQTFTYYVRENYNESLYWAKADLAPQEDTSIRIEDEPEEELEEQCDEGQVLHENGQWNITSITASPPIIAEPFPSLDRSASMASATDSAYFSGNTSREATTSSIGLGLDFTKPGGLSEINDKFVNHIPSPSVRGSHDSAYMDSTPEEEEIGEEPGLKDEVEEELVDEDLENLQSKGICAFCEEQILQGETVRGFHHTTLESLQEALTGHCVFCSDLYKDALSEHTSAQAITPLKWPRYSWTVRSNGRTRNSKQSLTVTFRLVSHGDPVSQPSMTSKRYHVLAETDIGQLPTEDTLGTSTDPKISGGAQLKDWIKICNETHPNCYKYHEGAFVPTRLVDLDIGDPDMVRVVETAPNHIRGRYGTLSHSWGPPNFLILRQSNKERLMGPGVRIDELSTNFQQAISVARFIGLKHIWIDSLCIMQGADGDFHSEGQLMHKVYRYSYCNIAIADSADSQGGLFRPRVADKIVPARFESDGIGKLDAGTWRILSEDMWKEELLGTKIYTRGWVFQERMLSPRILHFAASQIFWDCSTLSACEALPSGLPHPLDTVSSTDRHWRGRVQVKSTSDVKAPLVGPNDDSMESFWKSALLNYTQCNLTSQGDKTVAIWSIAKMVRDELEEEYGGGLWENALEEQLAWRMRECQPKVRIPELQMRNPSWSWASVKGPVLAHDRVCPPRCYRVTDHAGDPISFQIEPYGNDRDNEPKLLNKPIAMCGYIGQGKLEQRMSAGDVGLEVTLSAGKVPSTSSGIFDVFLDEALPEDVISSKQFEFMVLVASSTTSDGDSFQDSITDGPNSEDSSTTYSGTALLLINHQTYLSRQRQIFRSLREVVSRKVNVLIPDPPYGAGKSLVDQTTEMAEFVAMLETRGDTPCGDVGVERRYRRVGAVQFRDVGVETWDSIKSEGLVKILLD